MSQNSIENQEEILDSIINDFRKVQGVLSDVRNNLSSVVNSLSQDDNNYKNYIVTLSKREKTTKKQLNSFSSSIDGAILILNNTKQNFIEAREASKNIENKYDGE